MKPFTIVTLLLAGLPSLALAAPTPLLGKGKGNGNANANANANANGNGNAAGGGGATTKESNAQAAQNWMKDTGMVSNFLNNAPTLTGNQFTAAAKVALAAEKDELNHKAVLDKAQGVGNTANVKAASNVLATQGKFQDVVDLLQDMVTNGDSVAVKDTDAINANRCKNVLPNIDKYLAAAGTNLKAVRPTACDATGVTAQAGAAAGNANAGGNANANANGGATTGTGATKGGKNNGNAATAATAAGNRNKNNN